MYCPNCDERLVDVGGLLTCVKGATPLSTRLRRALEECFVARTPLPQDISFDFKAGANWFCPGCGVSAKERSGQIQCPLSSLSLNEFLCALVELHPHC